MSGTCDGSGRRRNASTKPEATIAHLDFEACAGGDGWRCLHGSCWVPAANRPALTCVGRHTSQQHLTSRFVCQSQRYRSNSTVPVPNEANHADVAAHFAIAAQSSIVRQMWSECLLGAWCFEAVVWQAASWSAVCTGCVPLMSWHRRRPLLPCGFAQSFTS